MSVHLTKDRARAKRRYDHRKASGQCVKCGQAATTIYCPPCRLKKRAASARHLAKMRAVWKPLGICLVCGNAKAIDGQTKCGYCAEVTEESNRQRRARRVAA